MLFLLLPGLAFCQQWIRVGAESQVSSVTSSYTTIAVIGSDPFVAYVEGGASGGVGKVKKRNAATGAWEQVGGSIGATITYPRLYTDKSNSLFVTYIDAAGGNRLAVVRFNAASGTWEPLLPGDPYVSSGTATYSISQLVSTPRSSLAFDNNNVPYLTYSERAVNGNPYVKRFVNGAWETLGGGTVAAGDTALGNSIAIDDNNVVYLVYIKQTNLTATTGRIKAFRFAEEPGEWEEVSPPSPVPPGSSNSGATTGVRHTSISLDSLYNPVVAYFNTSNSNRSTLIRFNRSTAVWNYMGTTGTRDAPYNSLVRDNGGNLYNTFTDLLVNGGSSPMLRVFRLSNGAPAFMELTTGSVPRGIDSGSVSYPNLAVGSDTAKPFLVYTKPNAGGVVTPVVLMYSLSLSTKAITDITTTSAQTGGVIPTDGGSAITERGIVYSTTNRNPNVADSKVVDAATGTGAYSITLTGLAPATTYFARAYYINGVETAYGNVVVFTTLTLPDPVVTTPKQMEFLTRGVLAVRTSANTVYVGWRLLGTDLASVAFNLYRDGVKLNAAPLTASTNFEDNTATDGMYTVAAVVDGVEQPASPPVGVWATNQLSIPLQIPEGGTTPDGVAYTYSANDCSVGDVDGDGEYEIFVKWDPSNSKDNSQSGYTGNVYIDCYKLNGTRLWRIDLGRNIRAGAHYTQFMVYDFDGDGKAEMACKTADATIDGMGNVIGDSNADYRNTSGYILTGPEYLTMFNGLTGKAMATANYLPARGSVGAWGDTYGNRVDRFIAAVAYLDGARPSLIMGRGYYTRLVRVAWDWRNGQLTQRWTFDSNDPGNSAFAGQGNHQMSVGDVDGDGKDEIFNGSSAINDNGKGLWADGLGHGDALHMTDLDPERPGQEMWSCLENQSEYGTNGLVFKDAKTGATIWGVPTTGDIGRAMAADIDPTRKGYEVWGSSGNLYDCKGNQISTTKPTNNFGIWWDGDLCRELLDGTKLDKWNYTTNSLNRLFTINNAAPVSANNSTKANPGLQADLLGDWREEMVFRRTDNTALILFTTTIPTEHRIYTLMHNPQYRTAIAWQNSAYNQPPYPDYYLGTGMVTPPPPNIFLAGGQAPLPVTLLSFTASVQGASVVLNWQAANEVNSSYYVVERSADGRNFTALETVKDRGNTASINRYSVTDKLPLDGTGYYRLKQVDKDGKLVYSKTRKIVFERAKQLLLYPNPASTFIKLEFPGGNTVLTVTLTNAAGKLVYGGSGSLTQINNSINRLLPGLTPGFYQVVIRDGDASYTAQLMKQ